MELNQIREDMALELIVANMTGNNICNNLYPGVGKTYTTIQSLRSDIRINPEHNWIIAVPTIKLARNISEEYDIPIILGKEKALIPSAIPFSIEKCYRNSCSKCEDRETCPYLEQQFYAQLLVCAYETVPTLEHKIGGMVRPGVWEVNRWYGLVIEEEPLRFWYSEMDVTEFIGNEILISDPIEQTVWNNLTFKFYHSVDINKDALDITNQDLDYFLSLFIQSNVGMEVMEYKGRYYLIGHRQYIKPYWIQRVIYNDATMVEAERKVIFGSLPFHNISMDLKIDNPMCRLGWRWGNVTQQKYFKSLCTFIDNLHMEGKHCLVITKKKLEDDIPHADVVHYGNSRGFNNNFKEYDLVIVYGSFFWDPVSVAKYARMGIGEDVIHRIEEAEIIQGLNRFRPYLQPDIPILFMTQDIEYDTEVLVSPKVIEHYSKFNGCKVTGRNRVVREYNQFHKWLRTNVFHEISKYDQVVSFLKEGKSITEIMDLVDYGKSTIYKIKTELDI